jgi:hypothetical protein
MLELNQKQIVLKNFTAIVVSFVLIFAATNCNSAVQPIFNQAKNLGTTSQMLLFISQTLTTLVLPLVLCETIGFKLSLMLAEICHLCYICAQLMPSEYTLFPSKFFLFDPF